MASFWFDLHLAGWVGVVFSLRAAVDYCRVVVLRVASCDRSFQERVHFLM